jgi:4-diphosphocytidyl-2-C-methyl-D-erythritol kinase
MAMAAGETGPMTQHFFNRLAAPARQLSPWIDRLLEAMRAVDLNGCQLTGSGSACFAMARSKRHAIRGAARLAARGFQVSFVASPLSLPTPLQ